MPAVFVIIIDNKVITLPIGRIILYERLQGDYGRVREGNANLSERLQEVKMENKALRGTAADFERARRAFGPEEVERAVEDAKRREQMEKARRRPRRSFDRGGR